MSLCVVLIEDDEALANAMKAAIEAQDAEVTWFADPPAAAEFARLAPDLLVLDCILGTTSGPDYLQQLRAEVGMEQMGVILTSGYPELLQQLQPLEGSRLALLEKPFSIQVLQETVQRVLSPSAA